MALTKISNVEWNEKNDQLPQQVRDLLDTESTIDKRQAWIKDCGLAETQAYELFNILDHFYFKKIQLDDLVATVAKELAVSEDKAKQIVVRIAADEFLPLDFYLGDIDAYVRKLEGRPPRNKEPRKVTARQAAEEALAACGVKIETLMEERVIEIMESMASGVRVEAAAFERLTRAQKIGGAGLSQGDAKLIIVSLKNLLIGVEIISEQALRNSEAASSAIVAPSAAEPEAPAASDLKIIKPVAAAKAATLMSISKKGDSVTAEDVREAEVIRERVLPKVMTVVDEKMDQAVKEAAAAVVGAVGVGVPAQYAERLRAVVESRLRDVRKTGDTRELLARSTAQGGIGFTPELADKTMLIIETQAQKLTATITQSMQKEKQAFIKTTAEDSAVREESRRRADDEELERMVGSLTTKGKNGTAPAPSAAFAAAPLPPSPKMQDVHPAVARLTGPAEELRNLTLADFRRLSADPAEACRKLGDKLDLLEEQSYGRRIEGIKAWQQSEVNQLYLAIITASFGGGKKIGEVIAGRQAEKAATLTEPEVHAIMEFNRKLKF